MDIDMYEVCTPYMNNNSQEKPTSNYFYISMFHKKLEQPLLEVAGTTATGVTGLFAGTVFFLILISCDLDL